MTKQEDISNDHKNSAIPVFPLGMMFITLGITLGDSNPELRLFILAGVGLLVSSFFSWRASHKKRQWHRLP